MMPTRWSRGRGGPRDPRRGARAGRTALAVVAFTAMALTQGRPASAESQGRAALRAQAERLLERAERDTTAGAVARYEQAAEAFLALWRESCEEVCLDRKPSCHGCDLALFQGASAFTQARRSAKAIAMYRLLLDPQYRLHRTELGLQAGVRIAEAYGSIGWFDRAAAYYRHHAETAPGHPDAPGALAKAIALWLRLGDVQAAMNAARRFERTYGRRGLVDAVRLRVAIAERLVDLGQSLEADQLLTPISRKIEAIASLDVLIRARIVQARAAVGLGDDGQARRWYAEVRGAWQHPQAQLRALDALGGDGAQRLRRLGQVLRWVGEAHYHLAAPHLASAQQPALPAYHGPLSRPRLRDHLNRQIRPSLAVRVRAIRAAEARLAPILALRPVPPPKWVAASQAAVAELWRSVVTELQGGLCAEPTAGSANRGDADPAARRRWCRAALRPVAAPLLAQAKHANLRCHQLSVRLQQLDERTAACGAWLAQHFVAEFPAVGGLLPQPNRRSGPLGERTAYICGSTRADRSAGHTGLPCEPDR